MEELDHENEQRRPLGMVLLGGLYLFFFMLTMSTFGHPFPFLGVVHFGRMAELLVFVDSMICLYLFLGIMKQQTLTWYLLIGYNTFEMINTLVNLRFLHAADLEKIAGQPVDPQGLAINNISVIIAICLLTGFIYKHRECFSNRSRYLF
ncbi:MAG: hypothetical protein A2X83_05135 [Desulfuromonadales bacterium GWD2_54_10]|nr:MAG: hypothetical protein A2X83_05135 [Desulfuromonadales bacterium GWD2_54_10]